MPQPENNEGRVMTPAALSTDCKNFRRLVHTPTGPLGKKSILLGVLSNVRGMREVSDACSVRENSNGNLAGAEVHHRGTEGHGGRTDHWGFRLSYIFQSLSAVGR